MANGSILEWSINWCQRWTIKTCVARFFLRFRVFVVVENVGFLGEKRRIERELYFYTCLPTRQEVKTRPILGRWKKTKWSARFCKRNISFVGEADILGQGITFMKQKQMFLAAEFMVNVTAKLEGAEHSFFKRRIQPVLPADQ